MEDQKEVKNAEVELDETEQVNRCYRHVNRLGITPAPWYKNKPIVADDYLIFSENQPSPLALYIKTEDAQLIESAPDLYEVIPDLCYAIEFLSAYVQYLTGGMDENEFEELSRVVAIKNNWDGSYEELVTHARNQLKKAAGKAVD